MTKSLRAFLEKSAIRLPICPETIKNILIAPADNYAVPSITAHGPEISQVVKEELEKIFIGEKTVEEGMADAKERADAILNE